MGLPSIGKPGGEVGRRSTLFGLARQGKLIQ